MCAVDASPGGGEAERRYLVGKNSFSRKGEGTGAAMGHWGSVEGTNGSGGLGTGLMVALNDLNGIFQPKLFYMSFSPP